MLLFHALSLTPPDKPPRRDISASASTTERVVTEATHDMVTPAVTACQRLSANVREGGCSLALMNVYSMDIMCCDIKHVWDPVAHGIGAMARHTLAVCVHMLHFWQAHVTATERRCCRIKFCHCLSRRVFSLQPQACHYQTDNKQLMTACVHGQLFLCY